MYFLLLIVQLIICNYLYLSQYIFISLLPVMILCLPLNINTFWAMIIAFGTGLCVDFLGDGLIGLNALAVVPVALFRKPLIGIIFGWDTIERQTSFNIRDNGLGKVSAAIGIMLVIFFCFYVITDNAGREDSLFIMWKILASLPVSLALNLLCFNSFRPREKR